MDHEDVYDGAAGSPALRPRRLREFNGQAQLCEDLGIFIRGARERQEALDHVLFYGPPGLGKTTLAEIIASELEVPFVSLSAPSIARTGDLVSVLVSLDPKSVLFIDEIHRLPTFIEETLYSAMEDYKVDVVIGEADKGQAITLELAPFTLVGATTRKGMLSQPLLDRFGIPLELRYYETGELCRILEQNCRKLGMEMQEDAVLEVARRSRGTPRIASRLLRRVRDYAAAYGVAPVDRKTASIALDRLGIDQHGMSPLDRRYLACLALSFDGGPVGVDSLAAALSEHRDTLEVTVEPFLLQKGFLKRTSRGRVLADLPEDVETKLRGVSFEV